MIWKTVHKLQLSCATLKFGGQTTHLSRDQLISCSSRSTCILSRPLMLSWHLVKKLLLMEGDFKMILTLLIDLMTLLGMETMEINQLRRDLIKHKLPPNLKPLVKYAPPGSEFLFGDDIDERIGHIS